MYCSGGRRGHRLLHLPHLLGGGKTHPDCGRTPGGNGELTEIQRAFIEEAAVQCGFCTPGIILSAVEIVGTGRTYTREELRKLISGHLCRCTGYQNILNAVEKAVNVCNGYVGEKQS